MSYCLIPSNVNIFLELIKDVPLSNEEIEKLFLTQIEKIEIQSEPPAWKIFLSVPEFFCADTTRTLSEAIVSSCGLTEVEFVQSAISKEYLQALKNVESSAEKQEEQNNIIYGKNIKGTAINIIDITEEERKIVIEGVISDLQAKELRTGRVLVTFNVLDQTDGIGAKIFFKTSDDYKRELKSLKSGINARIVGSVEHDKFAGQDLVFFPTSILQLPSVFREDNAKEKRVELHAHTRMSSLDAIVDIKDFVKMAHGWNHEAVAITDHGVVQAFPEAYEVASKLGIKLIYGMEGYLIEEDGQGKSWHIIILAKNEIGLRNLYKLVSLSHLRFFNRRPRIPRKILSEYRDGLILGSACEAGELYQAFLNDESEEKITDIANFYDYLEIQPTANNAFLLRKEVVPSNEYLETLNKKIYELGKRLKKKVVATCDLHFLNPDDEVYRRILQGGQGYDDADHQPPIYFRTTEEMLEEFAYLGKEACQEVVIKNTQEIARSIDNFKPIPDELYSPQIEGAEEEIKSMTLAKAKSMYGEKLPPILQERIDMELASIINNGFAVLYLIAHKLVRKSLDDGYLVGSRGSVGSSLVATLTDITEVNPLPPHWRCESCLGSEFILDGSYASGYDLPPKDCPHCKIPMLRDGHDIPFAVFMGFHGDKVPDIDLNFSGDYQPVAHKYTEELFGRDNVFRAGTISTIADKTAYGFVRKYFEERNISVRNARVAALTPGCTGVKRTTGQHPGGIMVVPRDLDVHYFTPIQRPADDKTSNTVTTHFDYHSISSRLVKLDILGHDDPTVIKMLEELTGLNVQRDIPVGDPATMSLFSSTQALKITAAELGSTVGTFGIPEFGTKFVRQMLEDIKPSKFSELVRVSGFSHGTDVWLNNAQDLIRSKVADVSETISARDDIMVYLIQKGLDPSHAFSIMESVRKGKGVSEEQASTMKNNNVPDWYITSCKKIKYMFPKAHAVAYVMMAYRIAYCKVHYPLQFYAAYFSIRAADFDANIIMNGSKFIKNIIKETDAKGNLASSKEKSVLTVLEIALEMMLRGFQFHKVDLYKSDPTKFVVCENALLPPLTALSGVSFNAAMLIEEARKEREFFSKSDMRTRAKTSRAIMEALETQGCLEGMPDTEEISLFG